LHVTGKYIEHSETPEEVIQWARATVEPNGVKSGETLTANIAVAKNKNPKIDNLVKSRIQPYVFPAQAGISSLTNCNNNNFEISACAGMTDLNDVWTFYDSKKLMIDRPRQPTDSHSCPKCNPKIHLHRSDWR
jgi:hypothetical protein